VNDHPETLLAEFVEGTLPPNPRAEVEAHLAGCGRCREEVALAREARTGLVGLPEVPAPQGLTFSVRRRARPTRAPRAGRWVAAAAAAAVLVAGGAVAITAVLGDGSQEAASVGDAPAGASPAPAPAQEAAGQELTARPDRLPTYVESNRDYSVGDLTRLVGGLRRLADTEVKAGRVPTAAAFSPKADRGALTRTIRRALACTLLDDPPEEPVVPFTIEAAAFLGEPAYVATFLRGPAPDRPANQILVRIVSRDSCQVRYTITRPV
jgi:Putative zinc-finger